MSDVTLTFDRLQEWQGWLEAQGRLSDKTRTQYLRSVLSALTIVLKPLDAWTEGDVVEVTAKTTTRGGYREAILKALMSYFRWQAKKYGVADPTEDFFLRKRRPGPPDYLTRDELERLFVAAEDQDPRARPTLELLYSTAARIGSVVALRPSDVDLDARTISFVLGVKNDAAYSLPLSPRGFAAAVRLLELAEYHPPTGKRQPGKLVGVSEERVRQWMRSAGAAAGISKRVYPHLLRHSAITHMSRDPSVSVGTIVQVANWQDPTPWRRYAATRQKDVSTALAGL